MEDITQAKRQGVASLDKVVSVYEQPVSSHLDLLGEPSQLEEAVSVLALRCDKVWHVWRRIGELEWS